MKLLNKHHFLAHLAAHVSHLDPNMSAAEKPDTTEAITMEAKIKLLDSGQLSTHRVFATKVLPVDKTFAADKKVLIEDDPICL